MMTEPARDSAVRSPRARVGRGRAALAIALLAAISAAGAQTPPSASAPPDRGEYVFRAAGCAACHTQAEGEGEFLAGGRLFDTPFGRFYSPNITPDEVHGIGRWSADDLWRALSRGEGPGGVHYYPVFPYPSYAGMRREDADALHGYLMRVPPVSTPNVAHELPWYMGWRFVNRVWKWLFLRDRPWTDDPSQSAEWNRGGYLVTALGHCGECHTPRDRFGVLRGDRELAGNPDGPEGEAVPNITPHDEDGIGGWSVGEIAEYLSSGMDPDTDFAGGAMAEVIDEGTSHLSREDRRAIAIYLQALPPIGAE